MWCESWLITHIVFWKALKALSTETITHSHCTPTGGKRTEAGLPICQTAPLCILRHSLPFTWANVGEVSCPRKNSTTNGPLSVYWTILKSVIHHSVSKKKIYTMLVVLIDIYFITFLVWLEVHQHIDSSRWQVYNKNSHSSRCGIAHHSTGIIILLSHGKTTIN